MLPLNLASGSLRRKLRHASGCSRVTNCAAFGKAPKPATHHNLTRPHLNSNTHKPTPMNGRDATNHASARVNQLTAEKPDQDTGGRAKRARLPTLEPPPHHKSESTTQGATSYKLDAIRAASLHVTTNLTTQPSVGSTKPKEKPVYERGSQYGTSPFEDQTSFVRHFRNASPYLAGHRGSTCVVVLPGQVLEDAEMLVAIVDDIAMLQGLGIKVVVVLGAAPQIDHYVKMRGEVPSFVDGYRLTDEVAMDAAVEAAGTSRTLLEALLSKGPAVPMVRRHTRTQKEFHYMAAMRVVSGNFVAAKRRGVVDGVDYGYTGEVRYVDSTGLRQQLDNNHLVLLSNLGYSTAGELLNCNTFDVAMHTAVELGADKLLCMHLDEVSRLELPAWLSINVAKKMFDEIDLAGGTFPDQCEDDEDEKCDLIRDTYNASDGSSGGFLFSDSHGSTQRHIQRQNLSVPVASTTQSKATVPSTNARTSATAEGNGSGIAGYTVATRRKVPPAVTACYEACLRGVKRAHLVDARLDGGILLELYSRDGIGTMISTDFYEGIRKASTFDVAAIKELLEPLEKAGIVVPRSLDTLSCVIETFIVVEREQRVLACAQLTHLGASENGSFQKVGEVAAFCVHPDFRGTGRGDSLLDWIEQVARCEDYDCLVLLTTRTADWFQARDFRYYGSAHECTFLPSDRRARVDAKRNSQLFLKKLEVREAGQEILPPGTRIGF